jgi:hypothetical protein
MKKQTNIQVLEKFIETNQIGSNLVIGYALSVLNENEKIEKCEKIFFEDEQEFSVNSNLTEEFSNDFSITITELLKDNDGSFYVRCFDQEDNWFDINLEYIEKW